MGRRDKKRFIFWLVGLVTSLGIILIVFFPSVASFLYGLPFAILNVKNCHQPEEFYVNEQVIYDEFALEGTIKKIQDKKPGKKQDCWYYRTRNSGTEILVSPTPSIVKIGTRKFKDPNMLTMSRIAGIRQELDNEPVSMYFVENYREYDIDWADGLYDRTKRAITLRSGGTLRYQKTILAHEYLHYVWYRDKLGEDQQLVNDLTAFYNRSPDLQQIMSNYKTKKSTEFFSYGCTEWSDRRLSQYILEKCSQYLDRSKLSMNY